MDKKLEHAVKEKLREIEMRKRIDARISEISDSLMRTLSMPKEEAHKIAMRQVDAEYQLGKAQRNGEENYRKNPPSKRTKKREKKLTPEEFEEQLRWNF